MNDMNLALLKKSHARFQRIVENSPEGVLLVAADGQILQANRSAEIMFGYAPGELQGQAVEVLIPDHLREGHRHDHRKTYARHPEVRRMNAGRELVARHKDGSTLPVEIGLTPVESDGDGEVIAMIRDLTVYRRFAELLADRSAQLEALFLLSPDGLVSFDPEGRVKLANPAFLRMVGLLAADVVGLTQGELDVRLRALAETPEQWEGLAACFAGQQARLGDDGTLAAADSGRRHRLELRRPRGAVLDLAGVAGDATSVSRLLHVRDVTHEIEVDRLKSEFLSHAAHELRTPMASIYGFTELLMNQEFDAETRHDLLATIHKQTGWLVDIINELLDLVRIESRRGKDFRIEAVPLAALVGETVAAIGIDPLRWPLAVDVGVDLPPMRTDAAKLRQALTNVLGNAVKYSPAGGAIEIRGATRKGEGRVLVGVRVTDHGIGMRPDQVARVCERFYRADTSGNIPGTGLGMSIVKEIVELLDGQIEIVGTPGVGTAVTLWLPAASADSGAPADTRASPSNSNASQEQS